MKESFLKVDDPFLPLTSPVPVTFTRFLACTFRKVWPTSILTSFCRCSYIFGITTYPLMDKWFPSLALNYAPKHSPWGLNGTKYWRLFIVEYFQPNKFKDRPNLDPTYQVSWFFFAGRCIMFPCISRERPSFTFCPGKKDHVFGKNISSFQIIQERSCAGATLFEKTIFSESLKKISYFRVFLKKDRLSFSV